MVDGVLYEGFLIRDKGNPHQKSVYACTFQLRFCIICADVLASVWTRVGGGAYITARGAPLFIISVIIH